MADGLAARARMLFTQRQYEDQSPTVGKRLIFPTSSMIVGVRIVPIPGAVMVRPNSSHTLSLFVINRSSTNFLFQMADETDACHDRGLHVIARKEPLDFEPSSFLTSALLIHESKLRARIFLTLRTREVRWWLEPFLEEVSG